MTVPYWRIGENIFDVDPLVIESLKVEYAVTVNDGLIIPFTQMQCIANGESNVSVNGVLDKFTLEALDRLANKYGVKDKSFPNFELYAALENNRLLNTSVSGRAWAAYKAFKAGAVPPSIPQDPFTRPAVPTSQKAPRKPAPAAPARPSEPAVDVTKPLEDLL